MINVCTLNVARLNPVSGRPYGFAKTNEAPSWWVFPCKRSKSLPRPSAMLFLGASGTNGPPSVTGTHRGMYPPRTTGVSKPAMCKVWASSSRRQSTNAVLLSVGQRENRARSCALVRASRVWAHQAPELPLMAIHR